ncbi:MAG TPA: hypothetical protein VFU15_04710 [Bacteroidia bacterium]|nr:hypothetical protein [Bacteroidia bacterium]
MCNCNKGSSVVKKDTLRKGKAIFPAPNSPAPKNAAALSAKTADVLTLPGETLADRCMTFAYMLGLDEPVSERVLVAALENPGYARRLLSSRDNEKILYDLLNNPPLSGSRGAQFSNGALITKAGKSLMKWALSGFPTVSKETLKRREDACLACPNLREPANLLQRFTAPAERGATAGTRTGNAICSSCGCVVRNKMRLSTESCPETISGNSEMTRWGEVVK